MLLQIKNWLFCGERGAICRRGRRSEIGSQIELTLKIKGRKEKPDEDNTNVDEEAVDDNDDDNDADGSGDGNGDDNDDGKKNEDKNKADKNGDYKAYKRQKIYKKIKKNLRRLKLLRRFWKYVRYVCRKRRCGKKFDLGDEDKVVLFKTVRKCCNNVSITQGR